MLTAERAAAYPLLSSATPKSPSLRLGDRRGSPVFLLGSCAGVWKPTSSAQPIWHIRYIMLSSLCWRLHLFGRHLRRAGYGADADRASLGSITQHIRRYSKAELHGAKGGSIAFTIQRYSRAEPHRATRGRIALNIQDYSQIANKKSVDRIDRQSALDRCISS